MTRVFYGTAPPGGAFFVIGSALAEVLNERVGAITLEGLTTNPHQPTLRFRGFTASPLLGLPQGIAVYQNGVRINEPFGDTVQFDLMPQFAVDRVQLSAGTDPTYGLNALGGALALRCGTPVVPVAHNAGIFWARNALTKYPGTIEVVVGPPIDTHGKSTNLITQEVEAWIENACSELPSIR